MKRRQWDEAHAAERAADELEAKRRWRALVADCPDCHGTNTIEVDDNTARKCHHPNIERKELHA